MEVIKGKFLDAYIIKVKVSFGHRQGIIIFILSKLRKKVLCIQSSFQNGFMTNVVNRFNVFANYTSKEMDKEIQDIESYKNYDELYSKRITVEFSKQLTTHLIGRFVLDLDKDSSTEKIEKLVSDFFTPKAGKSEKIKIEVGFEEIASVLYRNDSKLENNFQKFLDKKAIDNSTKQEEDKKAELEDKKEVTIAPKETTNIIGEKFSSFYKQNYRNFFFVESVVEPVNGVPLDELNEDYSLYFRTLDNNVVSDGKNIVGDYRELVENKLEGNYYLFSTYNDSILYSIENDLKVKLKVQK